MLSNIREWLMLSKKRGMKLGLERIQLAHQTLLGEPYESSILHIAGSNGKGTLCATLGAFLNARGHSTVMFTSPHLIRVEERIRIDGRPIGSREFDNLLSEVREVERLKNIELTFFEITFLVACLCAHRSNVAYFLVETGLGGRFDATRILPADVCILTSLALEHQDILGETLAEIASEKAAIARPGRPLIVREVLDDAAIKAIEAEAKNAGRMELGEKKQEAGLQWVSIPENTSFEREAVLLAEATISVLGMDASGLEQAIQNMTWPGRMQDIPANWKGTILFDAAHNPSGLQSVAPLLRKRIENEQSWVLVFGCTPQTDLSFFSKPLMHLCKNKPPEHIVLTKPQFGRYPGVSIHQLQELDWPSSSMVHEHEHAADAYAFLRDIQPSFAIVLGSLYLVGEMYETMGLWGTEHMELFPAKTQRDEA